MVKTLKSYSSCEKAYQVKADLLENLPPGYYLDVDQSGTAWHLTVSVSSVVHPLTAKHYINEIQSKLTEIENA